MTGPTKPPNPIARCGQAARGNRPDTPIDDVLSGEERARLTHPLPPRSLPGSGILDRLAADARGYASSALADHSRRAYACDWADWQRWCRRHGAAFLPPLPELVGLWITELATPGRRREGLSVATIERRLSGLSWACAQRGHHLDRADRHIATVLAGIRRRHARPPRQKEAVSGADICAMTATLGHDLRGLRDRAMLLIGFAGGLRRSEITGLDRHRGNIEAEIGDGAGTGWIEVVPRSSEVGGILLILRGKTGWREVEIGSGSAPETCPVTALETWLRFAHIDHGPVFRRISRDGTRVQQTRLSPQHVSLLVKTCIVTARLRPDLPEADRRALFSGHSLRAGLASHVQVDERYVQKQLGHASVEMTRRYQRRRERFGMNLTKAAGL